MAEIKYLDQNLKQTISEINSLTKKLHEANIILTETVINSKIRGRSSSIENMTQKYGVKLKEVTDIFTKQFESTLIPKLITKHQNPYRWVEFTKQENSPPQNGRTNLTMLK